MKRKYDIQFYFHFNNFIAAAKQLTHEELNDLILAKKCFLFRPLQANSKRKKLKKEQMIIKIKILTLLRHQMSTKKLKKKKKQPTFA